MNDPIQSRINLIGKIGKILAAILFVLSIIGAVFTAAGTVLTLAVPKDAATLTVSGNADIKLGGEWIKAAIEKSNENNTGAEEALKRLERMAGIDLDPDDLIGEVTVSKTADRFDIAASLEGKTFTVRDLFFPMLSAFLSCGASIFLFYTLKKLMNEFKTCTTPFTEKAVAILNQFTAALIVIAVVNTVAESAWSSFFSSSFGLSLDLTTLVMVAVVLLLAAIFKYGCRLQKETDETL